MMPAEHRYIHKKTGNRYWVIHGATDATNERDGLAVVVYYREGRPFDWFVREWSEFHDKFEPEVP